MYRRDPLVRRRASEIGGRAVGVPIPRPEIVLLHKAIFVALFVGSAWLFQRAARGRLHRGAV